ncbi:MAG: DciA family protein [Gammaproteobacteria bacterium]
MGRTQFHAESLSLGRYIGHRCQRLNALLTHAHFLRTLELELRAQLPLPLREHVGVANVRDEIIVLFASSPEWLTRLRFALPAIRAYLKRHLKLKAPPHVEIRVALSKEYRDYKASKPAPRRRLSPHASALLQEVAHGTTDPALQARFLALSRARR